MDFKSQFPDVKKRKEEFKRISFSNPNMIPMIVEPAKNAEPLSNCKFLVPKAYGFQEFQFNIRKKLKLSKETALFLTVNEKIVPTLEASMLSIYKEYKDVDGFLYVKYSVEDHFG